MPAVYEKFGVRFQYPENWTLETDEASPDKQSISVYSPGGAFWTVMSHSKPLDTAELASTAMLAMSEEYDELDYEEAREQVAGTDMVGYDLNFYCLDLTNTAWIRACRGAAGTYLVICQAEDREFAQMAPVFRAITASLLKA